MKAVLVLAVLALVCSAQGSMRGWDSLGKIANSKEQAARAAEAAAHSAERGGHGLSAELKALDAESAAAMAQTEFDEELKDQADSGTIKSSSGPVDSQPTDGKHNPPPPNSPPPHEQGVAPEIVDQVSKNDKSDNDGWTVVSSNYKAVAHKSVAPKAPELDEIDHQTGSLYDDIIADLDEMDYAVDPPNDMDFEEPPVEVPVEKTEEEIKKEQEENKEDEEKEELKHEEGASAEKVIEVPRPVPMEPAQAYFVALHGGAPKAARPDYRCELCMMVLGRKMAGQGHDLCAGLTHADDKVTCDHIIATMTAYDRYLVDWLYYEGCERYSPNVKKDEAAKKAEGVKEAANSEAASEATAEAGAPTPRPEEEAPVDKAADAAAVKEDAGAPNASSPALLQLAEDGAEKDKEEVEKEEEAAEEGDADAAKDNDEKPGEKEEQSEWVATIPCPPHALCSWMMVPGESTPFCNMDVTKYRRSERFFEKHLLPLGSEEKSDEANAAKGDKNAEESEPSTKEAEDGEKKEEEEAAKEGETPDEKGDHGAPAQPIPTTEHVGQDKEEAVQE